MGVCAHNGGDLDCHVSGFDCSGLTLYAWAPYKSLAHYAATQKTQAGRFHPGIGELVPGDLVFFSGYIADGIGHTAIYVGNGLVIQAAQSGTAIMRSRLTDVIAESGVYRGAVRPLTTGVQGAAPTVTSVTGQVQPGGRITVHGAHLDTAVSVSVAGTRIYSFVQRTATSLTVIAPAHAAGTVPVAVSTAWGTARSSTVYVGPPQISSISPASATGVAATPVTVTGTSLAGVTVGHLTDAVGTQDLPVTVVSDRQLTMTLPPHLPGAVSITLTSGYGTSAPVTFTYALLPTGSTDARAGAPVAGPAAVAHPTTSGTHIARSGIFDDRIGPGWYLLGPRARRSAP
ncbi:MAG: IPT/TIG domain-containing protein [Jatrophihabitans sp.]|uniref:IPT/TIG domain-containing protein n=1 Tax=Jatrophihabitans sp. TaxID=1932789 RepID=UPI003F814A6A